MYSSMFQRQLKQNAEALHALYYDKMIHRCNRASYYRRGESEQAALYTPYINKLTKKIRQLEQLQKFTKEMLRAAYDVENFEKKYVHLELEGMM